jgi:hypothetical protein
VRKSRYGLATRIGGGTMSGDSMIVLIVAMVILGSLWRQLLPFILALIFAAFVLGLSEMIQFLHHVG